MAAILALILLTTGFLVAPSGSLHETASAASLTGSMLQPQKVNVSKNAHPVRRRQAEPTAALRVAVWVATAVIAAALVAVAIAAAADQAQRYRRPARTGSKRWEAGWAGHVGRGRVVP